MNTLRSAYTDRMEFFGKLSPYELAKKYGTPLYIYNERILRERCRELMALSDHPGFAVNYSVKANANLALLRIIRSEGLIADSMSPGEVYVAMQAGFSAEQILYVCNNISGEEMRYPLERGILVSVDSLYQLEELGRVNRGGRAVVRFNPGIGAGHHKKVITAGAETKFGIGAADIPEMLEILSRYDMKLAGINQHIGSLFLDPQGYLDAVDVLLDLAREFLPDLELIDFGGGFGIPYQKYAGQERLDLKAMGREFDARIKAFARETGYAGRFLIESGRYISAECCLLLGAVHNTKNNGEKRFVGTDLGFNTLMRPVLYGSFHDIEVYREGAGPDEKLMSQSIVGNICESGDILAKDRELPEMQAGDLVAALDAGAYGYVMSSSYNQRLRPAEVLIDENGNDRLIRRRETLEDLLHLTPLDV
ncbi:MAG: diaminopimelate decarboxylase [Desulfovibrionaceae bacterium]|nr:diaminopimelate decarboxylase [Desulfovibrionaceae bacterium]